MIDRLRRLLRRFGMGERRWIPEGDERHRHTELVRNRLPADVPEAEAVDGTTPGRAADPTDSVTAGP
jgi:hypothetical protein